MSTLDALWSLLGYGLLAILIVVTGIIIYILAMVIVGLARKQFGEAKPEQSRRKDDYMADATVAALRAYQSGNHVYRKSCLRLPRRCSLGLGQLQQAMMAQEVELHGGPWHGQHVAVQDGRDHFHVLAPAEPEIFSSTQLEFPEAIRKKEGTYSRVFGMPGHFEWDGWRSHD